MKPTVLFFLVVLATTNAGSQARGDTSSKQSLAVTLLDSAEGLALEYRADIQLQILNSSVQLPQKTRKRVLEQLFQDAHHAKHAFKEIDVARDFAYRSAKLGMAFSLGLDGLSIHSRALAMLLRIDSAKAWDLATSFSPEFRASGCESPVVFDHSAYYNVMRTLLENGVSQQVRDAGDHVFLFDRLIREMASATQVAPVAGALTSNSFTRAEFEQLLAAFSGKLLTLPAQDRELSYLEANAVVSTAISGLAATAQQHAVAPAPLLKAYREFVRRGFSSERCPDDSLDRNEAAETVNAVLKLHSSAANVPLLTPEELQATKLGKEMVKQRVPDPVEFRGLLRPLMALRHSRNARAEVSPELHAAWRTSAEEFVAKLDALDMESDCYPCLFHKKADLMFVLFDFTPQGFVHDRVLQKLVAFLARNRMQEEGPLEWLFRAKLLVNLARTPTEEQRVRIDQLHAQGKLLTMLPTPTGQAIRTYLKNSGDPVLQALVAVEELLRTPYEMPPY